MRILFTSIILIALPAFASAGADCTKDDARYEDLKCAAQMLDAANQELDETYNAFLANAGQDAKEKLKESQRAWAQFRDADTALAYQNSGERGSLGELIATNHKIDLARVRTGQLKYLMHGPLELTRAVWDCAVGRDSLSTAATRLKSSEAIALAARAADKQGWHVSQYRQSSICFDASENQWTVFFEGHVLMPGNHFLVWVEDSTGAAAKIMPGQ